MKCTSAFLVGGIAPLALSVLVWGFLLHRRLEPTPGAALLLMAFGFAGLALLPYLAAFLVAKRWAPRLLSPQRSFFGGMVFVLVLYGVGILFRRPLQQLELLDFTPVGGAIWGILMSLSFSPLVFGSLALVRAISGVVVRTRSETKT